MKRDAIHCVVALLAALIPVLLITYVLRDLWAGPPPTLSPTTDGYRAGIERVCSASDNLVTISLTILGANVIWFLRNPQQALIKHLLIYAVFVLCIISLYLGVKLGFTAGLTLASPEPDIVPLLKLIGAQTLLALGGGLILSAVVIFSSLQAAGKP